MLIIIMGVTGAGKTTVGMKLAKAFSATFYDADDYHSASAIEKMKSGEPLTDTDRASWLERLESLIAKMGSDSTEVLACSALRAVYRSRLRAAAKATGIETMFVHLRVSRKVATTRLQDRQGHFMPASLVESQFAILEEPDDAIILDGTSALEVQVGEIIAALKARQRVPRGV
jgi:gluconokinase